MTIEEIRMECLKLAVGKASFAEQAVDIARKYSDFVEGTNDSEVIAAARALSEKVG